MNKDREPTESTNTPNNSSFVDPRPQRSHGTGRLLPRYDLLTRNEGPDISQGQFKDTETLLEEIRLLAAMRPLVKKPRGRFSF